MTDELKHYGILRRSGRYPWGSGVDAFQRSKDFYQYTEGLKRDLLAAGVSAKEVDKEIARLIGESTPDAAGYSIANLRDTRTIAKEEIVTLQTHMAKQLRERQWSIEKIAEHLDLPAPTVRLRLKNSEDQKKSTLRKTADAVRDEVDKHGIVDIGLGVSLNMGLSPERLRAAISVLRDEGYETYTVPVKNVGTKNNINQLVIVPPGTGFGGARKMTDKIHTMGKWTEDDGETFFGIKPPLSVNPKRLKVVYDEEGGSLQDGVIYVRPGVKDLDMGGNVYAQARIKVGDGHFLKGMAVVNKDMPPGVDLIFNTNKSKNDPKRKEDPLFALKPLKDDPENPFGSAISRQIMDIDPKTGKEQVKSAINIVNETGDWDDWRKSLPSQMLAKQPGPLIKEQLGVTRQNVKDRLAEIESITNPVVRRKKLEDYADQIDADAVDLRAAAMPRQRTQVIIPMPHINEKQIYAPNFESGEPVVLIRYPHGGRFEIPEVVVNNNDRKAKRLLGNAPDAIGIHPKVAERLSGADFDGDTVVVIPNPKGKIVGSDSMGSAARVFNQQLGNFNPKSLYGGFVKTGEDSKGRDVGNFPLMKDTGKQMGMITNLITDMSVQGAQPEHIVKAVKHSMVVIDAEKHKLNYKQSEIDNSIKMLRDLYQQDPNKAKTGGATTLLSRATAKERVEARKLRPAAEGGAVDKETGKLVYVPTGQMLNKYDPKTNTYMDGKDGRPLVKVPKTEEVKRLALTDDAFSLVRDPKDPVEKMYATHANEMKALANTARLRAARIENPRMNKQAKAVYKEDIDKLVSDLNAAKAQKPLERRAHVYAGRHIKQKIADDPLLRTDADRKKKVERQAIAAARAKLGLKQHQIEVSDRQWDAIMAGGVSANVLKQVLEYTDPVRIEALSMPRKNTVMTSAISSRAKAMLAAGATTAEVARALGVPASTLRDAANRGEV